MGCAIWVLPLDDEMYYWTWSQQLDWGYFDHPPMVALSIYLSQVFPIQALDIRGITVLLSLLSLLLWRQLVEPKNRKEKLILYLLYGSTLSFQILGFITTPDSVFILFGLLYILALKRLNESPKFLDFLLLSISMALVMYSKYFGLLLIVFSLIPFIKKFYKNLYFYGAVLFSIILYLPHIQWQIQHDWVTINYHLWERNTKEFNPMNGFFQFLLGFIAMGNLSFFGTSWKSFFAHKNKWKISLLYVIVGSLVLFVILSFWVKIQPQWNLVIYLGLFPLVYQNLIQKPLQNGRIKMLGFFTFLILLSKLILLFNPIETPMSKLKDFVVTADKKMKNPAVFERYQHTAAYQYYKRKESYNYSPYNHRKSQFDIWKVEEKMQGKDLDFVGLEPTSSNFIWDNYNKKEYLNSVSNFQSFPNVKFLINSAHYDSIQSKLELQLDIENPYQKTIPLSSEQEIILIGFSEQLHPEYVEVLSDSGYIFKSIQRNFLIHKKVRLPKRFKTFALGLRPKNISGKKQSDYFQFQ